MTTPTYEWDCETITDGDVVDHMYGACNEVLAWSHANPCEPGSQHKLVLVRDDPVSRSWAYITPDGQLPPHFRDAYGVATARVPQRFANELAGARETVLGVTFR